MKIIFYCSLSLWLINGVVFATNYRLGEIDLEYYKGPLAPLMIFDDRSNRYEWQDELYHATIFEKMSYHSTTDILDFWYGKVLGSAWCPDYYLNLNLDYMQYLYRLIMISYSNEMLFSLQAFANQAALDGIGCVGSWEKLFGRCEAISDEMKKFLPRSQGIYQRKIKSLPKKEENTASARKFLQQFLQLYRPKDKIQHSLIAQLVKNICLQKNHECQTLNKEKLAIVFQNACEKLTVSVENACNENIPFERFGGEKIIAEILSSSNVVNTINQGGMGKNCLYRYQEVMLEKFHQESFYQHLFFQVKKQLEQQKQRYIQGELFLPGALREFDQKGLTNFLKIFEPVVIVTATPIPTSTSIPTPTATFTPFPSATPTPTPSPSPLPTSTPTVYVSAFEQAKITLISRPSTMAIAVDMHRFANEFHFSKKVKEELQNVIKIYQTRDALGEMQKFDHLGTKTEPVRLKFIKYLVDEQSHQGLYNIINVIGKRFYVINDLEDKTEATLMELSNDEHTGNWMIIVLQDDNLSTPVPTPTNVVMKKTAPKGKRR